MKGDSARTGITCPKCDHDDARVFRKGLTKWVDYCCPRCSHLWGEREKEDDVSFSDVLCGIS